MNTRSRLQPRLHALDCDSAMSRDPGAAVAPRGIYPQERAGHIRAAQKGWPLLVMPRTEKYGATQTVDPTSVCLRRRLHRPTGKPGWKIRIREAVRKKGNGEEVFLGLPDASVLERCKSNPS